MLRSAVLVRSGLELLREFRMELDLAGRRLRLVRDGDAIHTPSERGIGAGFLRDGDAWTLAYVLEDGPAAAAGLVAGDAVTAIDGTPVRELAGVSLRAVIEQTDAVLLRVRRAGTEREIDVDVVTYVE